MSESPTPSSGSVSEETDTDASAELTQDSKQIQIDFVQALPAFVELCQFIQRKKIKFPTEPGALLRFIADQIREFKETDAIKEEQIEDLTAQLSELQQKLEKVQQALEAMTQEKQELRIALGQKVRALEEAETVKAAVVARNLELQADVQDLTQRFLDLSGPHHSTEESEVVPAQLLIEIDAPHSHPSENHEEVEDHHFETPVPDLVRRR